ncbi:AAA family ATPase [Kinneretia asaccharophila]|uniref:Dynein-related subfamily AAA family protein n=1 Tax=Roseateles asaccharophilus TaxID=582607 RepID=A0A4V3CJF9_9BURK|nr:AAA family ATPase [Roseateles asaccharophilus]MDN3544043.1 AAA family ATPase [Roseateles asaccharophilus]TDP09362.1 dynein-related subfamily AAA family protein [Roseateles asaccharophilus]
MPKYFSIPQIKAAVEHLSAFDSKWVIPPLVFASNQVDLAPEYKPLNVLGSPDVYLDNFFSGALIGLQMRSGGNSLRPKFSELQSKGKVLDSTGIPIPGADYLVHQKVVLWGSGYSRNGYEAMINRGQLEKQPNTRSSFRLTAAFQPAFEAGLPVSFRFEMLLIWLFAFREIPDAVNSWSELWGNFKTTFLGGNDFPLAYRGRFSLQNPALPWPVDFLAQRPTNLDYQRALIPSVVVEPLDVNFWQRIRVALETEIQRGYEGLSAQERTELSRLVVSGLSGTKRVFLLGDPGTGKSTLARIVKMAFNQELEATRFFCIESEITDKSTESTLVGFTGLDGGWIPGVLTAEIDGRSLLNAEERLSDASVRNQVNLIILDEANRKDIEVLLARLQTSLDSLSTDPRDDSSKISIGRDGLRYVSPFTYIVMTGNSPKDDEGRVEQSRPFKRRPSLIRITNPLAKAISGMNVSEFSTVSQRIWERCASDSQGFSRSADIVAALHSEVAAMTVLHSILCCMNTFGLGVSYGLLRKLCVLIGNEWALGAASFSDAVDGALCGGISALTGVRTTVDGASLRAALLQVANLQAAFPRFYDFVSGTLAETSEYGTVVPHF